MQIIIIIIIISKILAQLTFERQILTDTTEQYHVLITNQPLTSSCEFFIIAFQQDLDFPMSETTDFQVNFLQGNNQLVYDSNFEGYHKFSINNCPQTIEFIYGPLITPLIKATILFKLGLMNVLFQSNEYSTLLQYNEYQNLNFNIQTQSKLTSENNDLIIEYQPFYQLQIEDRIQINFPFRDEYAIQPKYQYFKYQLLNCQVEYQDGIIDKNILCVFYQQALKISKIDRLISMKITINDFINSQNTKLVEGITFQLIRFITSQDYILESKSGLTLQSNQISNLINLAIEQSNNFICNENIITLQIFYQDYLYQDTILILHFPNNFLSSFPTITIDQQMNQNFIVNQDNQIITISNFLISEGIQSLYKIYIKLQNPIILKDYNNFYVEYKWNSYSISQSIQQNLILQPLIFQQVMMTNQNSKLLEESSYCFTYQIDKEVEQNSVIEIQFYSDIQFTQNLNANNLNLIRNDKTITITNAIQQKQTSFCINGIINPPFIDMEHESYEFTIKYQQISQVIDKQQRFINLQNGIIEIIQLHQTKDKTNQIDNTITIVLKTQTGLQIGDLIIINLDNNKYDQTFLKNNNIKQCKIQEQLVYCSLINEKIQLQVQQQINAQQSITIQLLNFISNRSLNPINNIDIQTFHQLYSIDQLPYKPNLSVSSPNQLKLFAISSTNGKQVQNSQLFIYIKFIFPILQSDKILINLPLNVDCTNCVCKFENCFIQNSILTITNTLQINNIDYIVIENAINEKILGQINELTILVKDENDYLIYKDNLELVLEINKFDDFKIIPKNKYIGLASTYDINFISSIPIDTYDFFILEFDIEYQILNSQSKEIITIKNQQIIIELQRIIQEKKNVSLTIQNIINPKSLTSKYYYTLSHYNHNNELIQQSQFQSDFYQCSFEDCAICFPDYCQQCNYGMLKIQGNCLYDCPEGYFILNGSCKQCEVNEHCSVCSSNNYQICLECIDEYQLIDNQCIKIDKYHNSTNQTLPNNNTQTNSTQQIETNNKLVKQENNQNQIAYQIGLINYIQAGVFVILTLFKLIKRHSNFALLFSIFNGFTIPIFRIFSFILFTISSQYIFASFTLVLMSLSFLQTIHFLSQIDISLLTDYFYNENIKKQNNFYLNNILFKYYDFRIICTLKCKIKNTDFFNFQFRFNDDILKALELNFKRLIVILNPLQFTLLMISTQIIQCNNFQFEFLLFSSIEWLINMIVFYQLKKNRI